MNFGLSPREYGIDFHKDVGIIIPFQTNGVVPVHVMHSLSVLRATGWDWAPEGLRRPNLGATLKVWTLSPSHRSEDVLEKLERQGFTINKINITDSDLDTIIERVTKLKSDWTAQKSPAPKVQTAVSLRDPHLQTQYDRARYMWAHHNTQFTEWERQFATSIGALLRTGKYPSFKQQQSLDKMFAKYKIPHDARASTQKEIV